MQRPQRSDSDVYIRRSSLALYVPFGADPSRRSSSRRASLTIQRTKTSGKQWWKFRLRDWDDEDEQDWWFASTAIPLLAATIGPLANVLSIAALVTSWRMCLVSGVETREEAKQCHWNGDTATLGTELQGVTFGDPRWCYRLNVVSLIVGFVGNLFLLCNFTNRIRYIIALPVTIFMWYVATGILIGITVAMEIYVPPVRPYQTYSQGFWYAVFAAILYLICSMLLMVNMLGYFLGHYPQHFTLTDSQRTLILQTMLFFVWLAGGAEVFSIVERNKAKQNGMRWDYTDALYFCDVTILTVGFGDMYVDTTVGRGLLFPYSVGGIIMLGLMVSSIAKFAGELGSEKIVQRHIERSRARTVGRTVTSSMDLETERKGLASGERPIISAPMPVTRSTTINIVDEKDTNGKTNRNGQTIGPLRRVATNIVRSRKPKLILLREEKDRFEAMRRIQKGTEKFKRWYALFMSVTAFGILWCIGALVFWICERRDLQMTYFEALYFCYVSLLTIGYGDLAPKSNPGRPFFVVWSLVAVPTMTILISHLGDTVIRNFKEGTFTLADFTVLPKQGVWSEVGQRYPRIPAWFQQRKEKREALKRLELGFQTGPEPEADVPPPTIDQLAKDQPTHHEIAGRLAKAIKKVAKDSKEDDGRRYTYEEWVEFTQLIRFTARGEDDVWVDEEEGMVDWDWIGEDSPMMTRGSEASFILDRLCESMNRYFRRLAHVSAIPTGNEGVANGFHNYGTRQEKSHSEPTSPHIAPLDDDGLAVGVDPDDSGSLTISRTKRHATYEDED